MIRTVFMLSLLLFNMISKAQSIVEIEYFLDKEPGVGNGISVNISPADTILKSWSLSISGLSDGQHFLYVRGKDSSGLWSPWQIQLFFIEDTTQTGNIEKVEYFLDKETRPGNGTNVSITPDTIVNTEFQKSSQSLSVGRHFIHVRAKIKSGLWSPWQFHLFNIEDTIETGPINKVEYFLNKEPGLSKGNNVNIISGDTVKTEFTTSSSNMSNGRNYIHVRAKTTDGLWSPWQFQMLYLEDTIVPGPINEMEYFIDKDQGVGNGTPISFTSADTVKKNINYNTSLLDPGRHYFHVRSKNDQGLWSPWQFQMFLLNEIKDTGKIIRYSYVIDSSLLKTNLVQHVNLNPLSDSLIKIHNEKTDTALRYGQHYFRIWTLQNTNIRSTWHADTFVVINCPMLDTAIIKDPIGLCANDTLVFKQDITQLGIWPVDSFNFTWKINGNTISNLDSLKYKHNGSDSFHLQFSFTKKNDSRCKGSLVKPVRLFSAPSDTTRLAICNGDSALIHGVYRKTQGTYNFNGNSYHNCDSFSTVLLQVKPTYHDTFRRSICSNDSALIHGKFRRTAGTYFLDTTTTFGCDSLVWTILNVNPVYFKIDSISICQGDTLIKHGKTYTDQGIYLDTFKSIFGCDSIFLTHLRVDPIYDDTSSITICQGDSAFIHNAWRKSPAYYTFNGNTFRGCDSASTIHLIVHPSYHTNQLIALCQGDSALIHGQFIKLAGSYTYNGNTFLGCDSIVNVQVIVNPTYHFNDSFEVCNGDTLNIHGKKYFNNGTFRDSFKTINGCDSIFITHLIVHPTYAKNLSIGICSNDSFLFDGTYRFSTDTIIGYFNTVHGCDSIVTLYLKVDSVINTETFPEICDGDSLFIGGTFRKIAGDYKDVYYALKGCDSIVTRHLKIIKKDTSYITVTICQRETFSYHGNNYTDTGIYEIQLKGYRACDSTVYLRIEKTPEIRNIFSGTVCHGQGFFAGKSMKFGSGTFFDTLQSYTGCDSIVIYTQSERATDSGYLTTSICQGDSIFTGNSWKKTAGNYSDTLVNRFGCDSIVNTILSVRNVSFTDLFDTICHGESVIFNGNSISLSGSYKKVLDNSVGCDSTVTLHLYKRPQFIPRIVADGFARLMTEIPYSSYQWYLDRTILQGDTFRIVEVTQSGIYDVSVTDSIGCRANSWDDLLSNGSLTYEWPLIAYPNPANGSLTLKANQMLDLEVYNGTGQSVLKINIDIGETILNTGDWPEGIYNIRVSNGKSIFAISVVILH